jgi:hypothetical protein
VCGSTLIGRKTDQPDGVPFTPPHAPRREADAHIPLHTKVVAPCDWGTILAAANSDARADLLRLRAMLSVPGDTAFSGRPLPVPDGTKLLETGNAEIVSAAMESQHHTTGTARPFTVIEEKPEGPRRRLILWPKAQNDALQLDFRSQVPIAHVSRYLDAVLSHSAVLRDLTLGFWQIELTPKERANFRFRLEDGRVAQPTRLPMGLCVSVDIMQRVTEILAGHPRSSAVSFSALPDVYIDGLRLAASSEVCGEFSSFVDSRAERFGITLKEKGTPPVRRYDFVGVCFDHLSRSVVCGEKTLGKLSSEELWAAGETSFDALRRTTGRLLFAAACNRTPLASFYFLVKKLRRLISGFNRGAVQPNSLVGMSGGFRAQLRDLFRRARQPLAIRASSSAERAVLFSDASLSGWGGVLMSPTGELSVVGERWTPEEAARDISVLELDAVRRALLAFSVPLSCVGALSLRVDNTSVLAALRRGGARAEALNAAVLGVADDLRLQPKIVDVDYVRSAENPADFPSRGLELPDGFPMRVGRGTPTRIARTG